LKWTIWYILQSTHLNITLQNTNSEEQLNIADWFIALQQKPGKGRIQQHLRFTIRTNECALPANDGIQFDNIKTALNTGAVKNVTFGFWGNLSF